MAGGARSGLISVMGGVATTQGGYSWACSAWSGWGRRGPEPELLAGLWARGLAQVVAHQRAAYFLSSHILAQPPRAWASAQAQ
jgi:hypothetical protein